MIRFLARRLAYMAVTVLLVSFVSFLIVQAAPGDYAAIYAAKKAATGAIIRQADIDAVRVQLGLDKPWYVQYGLWLYNAVFHADFGDSWQWKRPVGEVIAERMPLTLAIAFGTLVFMYAISIPVGIYAAVRRYSFGDYASSFIGYLGLATPNFLLALVHHVSEPALFRAERRRPVLAGIRKRTLEHGEVLGPAEASRRARLSCSAPRGPRS